MKTALQLSACLNCCLVVFFVLLALNGRVPVSRLLPRAASEVKQESPGEAEPQATTTAAAEPKQCHWSQIESSDYLVYIANLRAIGCPEQTIRDIIIADIDSLFASRREPLERKLRLFSSDSRAAGSDSRPLWEAELLRLRREEASLIWALLKSEAGATKERVATSADALAPSQSPRQNAPYAVVCMPLVFQDVDWTALKLDSGQRQVIDDLRQRFVEELGGPCQNPSDPAYRERWQQVQPENDSLLRGLIGVNAWQDYQLAARRHE
jgi:hypothetical protein